MQNWNEWTATRDDHKTWLTKRAESAASQQSWATYSIHSFYGQHFECVRYSERGRCVLARFDSLPKMLKAVRHIRKAGLLGTLESFSEFGFPHDPTRTW